VVRMESGKEKQRREMLLAEEKREHSPRGPVEGKELTQVQRKIKKEAHQWSKDQGKGRMRGKGILITSKKGQKKANKEKRERLREKMQERLRSIDGDSEGAAEEEEAVLSEKEQRDKELGDQWEEEWTRSKKPLKKEVKGVRPDGTEDLSVILEDGDEDESGDEGNSEPK
jgi:hypothetical protein